MNGLMMDGWPSPNGKLPNFWAMAHMEYTVIRCNYSVLKHPKLQILGSQVWGSLNVTSIMWQDIFMRKFYEILCSGLPPRKQLEPRQGHGKHETTSTEKTSTGKWEYVDIFAKQGLLNPHFAIHTLPISACCRNLHRTAPKMPPAHKGWLAAQSRFLTDIGCQVWQSTWYPTIS